jgi:polyisoprenoid-binding protein YceI
MNLFQIMKLIETIAVEKSLLLALASLGCAAFALTASGQTAYRPVPRASTVRIQGTSTAHDWEMKGAMIGGQLQFGAGVKLDPAQASIAGAADGKVPATVTAIIPVFSIKSEADHVPEYMERLMQEALKEPQFKNIEYHLSEMKLAGPHAPGKPFEFDTTGQLALAGVTNKVSFPVTIEKVEPDKLKISASVPLKMTDYGVTPPAPNFGLGLMRCGDKITILFDWILTEKK